MTEKDNNGSKAKSREPPTELPTFSRRRPSASAFPLGATGIIKCWVPPGAAGAAHSEEDPHDANLHSPAKGAAHPMKPVSRSWRRNRRWVPHGNFREPRRIGGQPYARYGMVRRWSLVLRPFPNHSLVTDW